MNDWQRACVIGARLVGLAGSVAIAAGGLAAGALPIATGGRWLGARDWRPFVVPGLLISYLGLVLLCVAWWWLGREIQMASRRELLYTCALWAAPLVVCPPLFSRDVYSYVAQGTMVLTHIDVYQHGVSRLGGQLAAEVPDVWQHTPAPYGPAFLSVAAAVMGVVDAASADLVTGLIGMRVTALVGLAALVACLPALARHCGVDPAEAMWLGALNPLVMLHLVAGAHNEALMMGLLGVGLTVAFRQRYVLATVLITLAALVKAPAILGLAVVGSMWHKTVRVGAIAVLTAVVVTEATGIGYGWIGALHTSAAPQAWSLTTAIGRAFGSQMAMVFWISVGLVATVAICIAAWWHRRRLGEVYALGLGLAAVGMLGPATRPWYALWGLVPLAASAPTGRVRYWAAAVSTGLTFILLPNGLGLVTVTL